MYAVLQLLFGGPGRIFHRTLVQSRFTVRQPMEEDEFSLSDRAVFAIYLFLRQYKSLAVCSLAKLRTSKKWILGLQALVQTAISAEASFLGVKP